MPTNHAPELRSVVITMLAAFALARTCAAPSHIVIICELKQRDHSGPLFPRLLCPTVRSSETAPGSSPGAGRTLESETRR